MWKLSNILQHKWKDNALKVHGAIIVTFSGVLLKMEYYLHLANYYRMELFLDTVPGKDFSMLLVNTKPLFQMLSESL